MSFLVLLLLMAPPEDLMPREGAGWAGFKEGTWVRLKQTTVEPGRMRTPTISRITLTKVEAKTLSFEGTAENALGVGAEVQKWAVATTGDAWPGESEKVEGRGEEAVKAAGRDLLCDKVESTMSGTAGRRVVTKWIAREPKALAKRVTITYGPDGKELKRETMLLQSLAEERECGGRKVRCVKYETRIEEAGYEWKGVAFLSRDVPAGIVWSEEQATKDGQLAVTRRLELLDFSR